MNTNPGTTSGSCSFRGCTRSPGKRHTWARGVVFAFVAGWLAGCGGGTQDTRESPDVTAALPAPSAEPEPSPPDGASPDVGEPPGTAPVPIPAPAPPLLTRKPGGHYSGVASAAGRAYYAEALRTQDGFVHIHVGTELEDGGAGIWSGGGPGEAMVGGEDSYQFLGKLEFDGDTALSRGVVIGQMCAAPSPGRFCDGPAPAELFLPDANDGLNGEIRLMTGSREETVLLEMGVYNANYYRLPASLTSLAGNYRDRLAQISLPDGMVLNVSDAGEVFFQSADSHCTANGTALPHLGGRYYVFDIMLSVRNCDADFDHLNNDFVGFATHAPSGAWSYDEWLILFLATPESVQPQAAMTLYAEAY